VPTYTLKCEAHAPMIVPQAFRYLIYITRKSMIIVNIGHGAVRSMAMSRVSNSTASGSKHWQSQVGSRAPQSLWVCTFGDTASSDLELDCCVVAALQPAQLTSLLQPQMHTTKLMHRPTGRLGREVMGAALASAPLQGRRVPYAQDRAPSIQSVRPMEGTRGDNSVHNPSGKSGTSGARGQRKSRRI
jgi:hypothetical protein